MSDLIDREVAIRKIEPWLYSEGRGESEINMLRAVIDTLKNMTAVPRWVRCEEEMPKLPDKDYCHVWCVGWFEGQTRSVPMEYGRILKRGKREERWLLYDRISLPPTKWAYLPEPPKEDE